MLTGWRKLFGEAGENRAWARGPVVLWWYEQSPYAGQEGDPCAEISIQHRAHLSFTEAADIADSLNQATEAIKHLTQTHHEHRRD